LEQQREQQAAAPQPVLTPGPAGAAARTPASFLLALQRSHGNAAVTRWLSRATAEVEEELVQKDDSARFEGDKGLEDISKGAKTLSKGAKGVEVTKLQQALVDMGFKLAGGVTGSYEDATVDAVKAFQKAEGISPETGNLDQETLKHLNARYDTRRPYIDNAKFDSADPGKGTRALSADDKAAVTAAMVPARGTGGAPAAFTDEVGGVKYGDEIKDRLTKLIAGFHKRLYEDKKDLRKDPGKNFHAWSVLEGAAAGSKKVVDALYGSYVPGKPPPAMTHAKGNFIDQWDDELARNAKLKDPDKEKKAVGKVWYLIASNCREVNKKHGAVPTDAAEKAILTPIVADLTSDKTKIQTLLDLEIGWEGAQLEGVVYLQRYKQDTDEKNRAQLWELVQTCIHEYLHGLTHPKYAAYAQKQDSVRYNTLIEGFCDFFTETVRKTVKIDEPLRKQVEGPYYDSVATVPTVKPGVYPSIAQAEQVVSIVGIRNAESAYFRGEVEKIGGP
jgi:peptidoglycan hydrolase-like protein with peptidoglycan-binding domain